MLALTRKAGQSVIIGDDVIVTVLGVKGNQIQLGFEAPKQTSIHRKEIYLRIQAENEDQTMAAKAHDSLSGALPVISHKSVQKVA